MIAPGGTPPVGALAGANKNDDKNQIKAAYVPDSLHTTIFSCTTLTSISFLHWGQYNGNFIKTVSS